MKKNVAQNSWNYEFFNNIGTSLYEFDPSVDGNYIIYLRALKTNSRAPIEIVAETCIQVLVGSASAVNSVMLPRP